MILFKNKNKKKSYLRVGEFEKAKSMLDKMQRFGFEVEQSIAAAVE